MIAFTCRKLATILLVLVGCAFTSLSSHAQTLNESVKLTPSDNPPNSQFGFSMSSSGDTLVVGARNDASVYVYRFDGNAWIETQKITAPSDVPQFGGFGSAVAVSGDTAVFGAQGTTSSGGAAYIYRFDGSIWNLEQKLIPGDDEGKFGRFGRKVAASGDTIVISAPRTNGTFTNSGAAYVFRFDGNAWIEVQKITASDAAENDLFGRSVALSGDTAVIGAISDDDVVDESGSAYVYRFDGSSWIDEEKLTASDPEENDGFGAHVSVSGDTVAVGTSPYIGGEVDAIVRPGSVYVYRFDGDSWIEEQELTTLSSSRALISSLVVREDTLVLSTTSNGAPEEANVYRFDGSIWDEGLELVATDRRYVNGDSVAVHRNTALVAGSGAAYVFSLDDLEAEGPEITTPVPGSVLSGPKTTFSWTDNGAIVDAHWVYVGSSLGGNQYFAGGPDGSVLSVNATELPTDGSTVYVRLWLRDADQSWTFVDYTYTAASPQITTPVPGSVLSGPTTAFSWKDNGAIVDAHWVYVGSSLGGNQYFEGGPDGTVLSVIATELPTDGSTVYVRLWLRDPDQSWTFVDYTYTAGSVEGPKITTPVLGSVLSGPTTTFSWTDIGADAVEYLVYVGSSVGGNQYQYFAGAPDGTVLSANATRLPTDGSIVYVRLLLREAGQSWTYVDYTYTAASVDGPKITAPVPGSVLSKSSSD